MSAKINAPQSIRPEVESPRWHWHRLLEAPHRLGFFCAVVVLALASVWWAGVQLQRTGALASPAWAVSPTLVHGAVMTFGFMPLFFAGFLFTAGPKWLGMQQPTARSLVAPLAAQLVGWIAWIAGSESLGIIAVAGLALAFAGLAEITRRFWQLVVASRVPDRMHAQVIGCALLAGCGCLAGIIAALLADAPDAALMFVHTGLWTFIVVVFVAVAHRMIPFFTSSAVPFVNAWRPSWVLGLLVGAAVFEAVGDAVDAFGLAVAAWHALRGMAELAMGGIVAWLAFRWGLVQSLKIRLLAMLHLGFLWLGFGLLLSGGAQLVTAATGETVLPLAPFHAVTMGCLGSLMIAMVTRVSCGHSGRSLVADNLVWTLFWLAQAAALLRIAAAVPSLPVQALLVAAAIVWAAIMVVWGVRYGSWYGRPRADGKPG